jgi:hypothetical protein
MKDRIDQGVDVMIFFATKCRFQLKPPVVFEKNLAKFAENCEQNIDPQGIRVNRLGEFSSIEQEFMEKTVFTLGYF